MDTETEAMLESLLLRAGYDPGSPHLLDTPARWARMIEHEFACPQGDVADILNTEFPDTFKGMVVVKDVEFVSLCAHHLLPFHGTAHVGYLPEGKVVGISKLARLVEHFAKRITVQEVITREIVDSLQRVLEPKGAIAMLSAVHMCMVARGVRKPAIETITTDLSGAFIDNLANCKSEFYSIVGAPK